MKKYFYLAAVSAMMLTACSSENDVVQPTTQPTTPQVTVQQQAVAFDTYLSGTTASTRAGDPTGVMTTEKLKTATKGFGVFAFYHDADAATPDLGYTSGTLKPNFMFNEHVSWNNGWSYSPLKYWPNETAKDVANDDHNADSQSTPATAPQLDKLSFFAYAPYVSETATLSTKDNTTISADGGTTHFSAYHASETSGISAISSEVYTGDPLVEWKSTTDLDNNVDLLWGVAPKGMDYTAVNGTAVTPTFGIPLLNLVKPDKDQKIKFLFQHALSRIGLSVVSAIDQIAAGDDGGKFNKDQTRVLIEEVAIWGDFCTQGVLNLYNTQQNVANWVQASIAKSGTSSAAPLITLDQGTANGYLSPDLRYVAADITAINGDASKFADLNIGVLPSEQTLLSGNADPSKETTDVSYSYGTVKYKKQADDPNKSYVIATTTESSTTNPAYIKSGDDYIQVRAANGTALTLDGITKYVTLDLGSVTAVSTAGTGLTADAYYYFEDGTDYKYVKATGSYATGNYYLATGVTATDVAGSNYAAGTYYTGLIPRYFMFIPSKTGESTNIGVRIKYHVVTKDTKLDGNVSDVTNTITKETTVELKSGKSYNLKLILGLTSVKLDATVADWQVADDAEVWLPQNNE